MVYVIFPNVIVVLIFKDFSTAWVCLYIHIVFFFLIFKRLRVLAVVVYKKKNLCHQTNKRKKIKRPKAK